MKTKIAQVGAQVFAVEISKGLAAGAKTNKNKQDKGVVKIKAFT